MDLDSRCCWEYRHTCSLSGMVILSFNCSCKEAIQGIDYLPLYGPPSAMAANICFRIRIISKAPLL